MSQSELSEFKLNLLELLTIVHVVFLGYGFPFRLLLVILGYGFHTILSHTWESPLVGIGVTFYLPYHFKSYLGMIPCNYKSYLGMIFHLTPFINVMNIRLDFIYLMGLHVIYDM